MQTYYTNGKQYDPQPVQGIMDRGSLHHLIRKAKVLMLFNQALADILPSEFTGHYQVMNLRDEKLLIATDNASLAMRLRYGQQEIIQQLRQFRRLGVIRVIEVKVRPVLVG